MGFVSVAYSCTCCIGTYWRMSWDPLQRGQVILRPSIRDGLEVVSFTTGTATLPRAYAKPHAGVVWFSTYLLHKQGFPCYDLYITP